MHAHEGSGMAFCAMCDSSGGKVHIVADGKHKMDVDGYTCSEN